MKTSKRLLAVVASIAITASMLAVPVSAEENVFTENFDDTATVGSYWTGSGNSGIDTANGALIVTGASGGGRNRTITFEQNTGDADYASVEFDFNAGNFGYAKDMDHYFALRDSSENSIMTFSFVNTQYVSDAMVKLNGEDTTVPAPYRALTGWYTVNAILNFADSTFDYTITALGSDVVVASGEAVAMQSTATNVGQLYFVTSRHTNPISIDNFTLATLDGPTVSFSSEDEVTSVGLNETITIAEITDAESIEVSSADEAVATVSEDGGVVSVAGVSNGKTDISIVATSSDGVVLRRTVTVAVGSVELVDVAVKYIDSNNNEIADGYIINDVLVGSEILPTDLIFEEKIETSDYRYTTPEVESYTVLSGGANVIFVVYTEQAAAVSAITASYSTNEAKIADITVEIGGGYYIGDTYTFISNNYVTDADGVIYAVGNDYTEDAEATTLNNSATPVNSVLMQTVTLAENTTVAYTVAESPNADFYSEWEDIFGVTATGTATGRNVASGGKMCYTSSTVSFYEVPATGYYQVVITGGPKNRGFAIYQNAELAAAATAVDDGTAFMYNSLVGDKSYNNDQYGLYIAKTGLFNEGDNLTLRGFGTNGASDNLDYVLVRRIVSGDIIGADGVSIIPGGQSAEFTFDSGLDAAPTWSVTGVEGVTVDENGVVTVAEDAQGGTATLTATIESAGVEGSKELTIAKASVESFTFNGASAFSNGQDTTYSVSDVKDQFGVDITDAVTVTYVSADDNIVSIDETTGIATAKAVGEVEIEVTVSVGDSSLSDSKTVTIKNYFLTGEATGDETAVDASDLIASDNIIGYMVTTAKDGKVVAQTTVAEVPTTVDTTGADSYEIAPVYKYESVTLGTAFADSFADGMYNITFKKGDTKRADINVNGYMVGNNVDQYGEGRGISEGAEYTINDAVIECGSITVTTSDLGGNGSITWVQLVKAPSNVNRTKKVYVTGDSLVANYYGTYAEGTEVGGARTGWGQVLNNFFTDDVEVVNLANSGAWAVGLLTSAVPGVMAMAQPGDYFIIESGYNDRANSTREELYNSVVSMVEQCEAKGIIPVLVSPNASAHDYKVGVQYASTMNDVAAAMQAKYDDVIFVDLAKLSYEFMIGTGISHTAADTGVLYSADKDENGALEAVTLTEVEAGERLAMPTTDYEVYLWTAEMKPVTINVSTSEVTNTYNLTTVGGDTLHSSYAAATKWAEIVAQGMKDAGVDFVSTEYSYTFTDTIGNEITCQVK